jgi:MFS family permease
MPQRAPMRAQIGTLILATSGIQLANGFFNTLISLRVAIEDFGPTMAGLVLSSYFAGFTLAALRCGRIIERIGHIRAYATFAGLVVVATAIMPLLIGGMPWLVLRTVIGFGCAASSSRPKAGSMPRPSRQSAGASSPSTWSAPSSPSQRDSS